MEISAFLDEILFVIVLYKIKPEQSPAYEGVRRLMTDLSASVSVFIYDNSPQPCVLLDKKIIYRHDPDNSGVAKAYNEGFTEACRLNKKWLLLLDQDTQFDLNFIRKLSEAIQNHPASVAFVPRLCDRYGEVSPFRWSFGRGKRTTVVKTRLALNKFRFLNSGLLISCAAFQQTGGYQESIPLYFSDIAFGEKLKKAADHFIVIDVSLQHSFSASEDSTWKEALHRYAYFCLGAFAMGKTFGSFWLYYFRALLRGLNLSVKYKNSIFLKTFLASNKW